MNYKALSIICAITWLGFVMFLVLDSMRILGFKDIGITESLSTSGFARGMFMDIGILSTLIAGWMVFGTKEKLRWIFGIITLFVGSLGVLPFLAIYFWNKE